MTLNRRTFLQTCTLSALAASSALPVLAQTPNIRYGGSGWLAHYPAYLAMELGLLKQAGIEQQWSAFGTSSSRMSAVMSGDIDIASTGVVSAIALMARGAKQFSIIGIPESFGRVEGILVRDGITDISALKGKKVGVTFASSAHMLVLDLINQAGMTPKDVVIINIPAPELPAAIASGQIDAAATWTPYFDIIRRQDNIHLLADDTQFSLYQSHQVIPGPDVLIVNRQFAQKNPTRIRNYLQAYFQAIDILRDRPQDAARALMTLTQLSLDEQLAVIQNTDWYTHAQQPGILNGAFIDGLQQLAELLLSYKQIDRAPTVHDWIDPSFV